MARQDDSLPDLSGRVAVVTGGSGGVGRGIAGRLAVAGADVVVHYHRAAQAAEALAASLREAGGRAVTAAADVTDPADCESLMRTAMTTFGGLDILINAAGIQPVQGLDTMSVADWRAVVDTNVTGVFAATQAAVRAFRGGGSVIHIASIEAVRPAVGHAHYSASKSAVVMHAQAAALEYGARGIRVNCVLPGLIDRPGLADSWPEGVRRWTEAVPLGRLGENTDIGDACVFLASPMARWITGQALVVDGGMSVRPAW